MDMDKNMNMKEYHSGNKAFHRLFILSNLQLVKNFIHSEMYCSVLYCPENKIFL
jgi:hypothetical protein